FLRLIFVLAEIQDLAHRRLGMWCDLHEIEPGLGRARQCVGNGDHADIMTGSVDELDVRSVNALVDTRAPPVGCEVHRPSCDVSISFVVTRPEAAPGEA